MATTPVTQEGFFSIAKGLFKDSTKTIGAASSALTVSVGVLGDLAKTAKVQSSVMLLESQLEALPVVMSLRNQLEENNITQEQLQAYFD